MNYLPIKLEKLRKHYNYSQSYLAEVLNIDVIDYMGYENGRKMINYEQAKKLASLYHIEVAEIFKNDENVTLYKVDEGKTDEINIEYFIPKKTIFTRIKEHPIVSALLVSLFIVVIILANLVVSNNNRPYVIYADNTDRLSVSKTSLTYIDNVGAVKGSGDNANGQISNLPSEKAIKVEEGSNFTVVLLNDGTLVSSGLLANYEQELKKLNDIVDIACGDNHIVAVDSKGRVYAIGDNTYKQCDVNDFEDIVKVFASSNGTICIDEDGNAMYTGNIVGTSKIKNGITKADTSGDNIIVLKKDGTVDYAATPENSLYIKIYSWTDIVDVACGSNFFAGLRSDGTVQIASINLDENTVIGWKNIVAIDAADDYLVAFDSENIFGVGKNTYHQFPGDNKNSNTLSNVQNIFVDYDNQTIRISFDSVENASEYEVTLKLGDGTGLVKRVKTNELVSFDTNNLYDNELYTVTVQAIGEGIYENSAISSKDFIYIKEVIFTPKEETITIGNYLIGMNKADFEEYINDFGVFEPEYIESDEICDGSDAKIVAIKGIKEGSTYTISEAKSRNVEVSYCKIKVEENDE